MLQPSTSLPFLLSSCCLFPSPPSLLPFPSVSLFFPLPLLLSLFLSVSLPSFLSGPQVSYEINESMTNDGKIRMSVMNEPIEWPALLTQRAPKSATVESFLHSRARGRLPKPHILGEKGEDCGGKMRKSKWSRNGKLRDKGR